MVIVSVTLLILMILLKAFYKVMQVAPERRNGADGLPVPPYAIYNIGNNSPENLLDFVTILGEELIGAGVLPADFKHGAS